MSSTWTELGQLLSIIITWTVPWRKDCNTLSKTINNIA